MIRSVFEHRHLNHLIGLKRLQHFRILFRIRHRLPIDRRENISPQHPRSPLDRHTQLTGLEPDLFCRTSIVGIQDKQSAEHGKSHEIPPLLRHKFAFDV